ncbi:MAG: response regulator [Candidatus Poribacteria bacterium]|nr:response regulator [Candidatus Poribacteria bacterium]
MVLQALGYKVTTRSSSVEALEKFCAEPEQFDLVITDLTMPNLTGVQLAQELMRIRPNIPIILMTGFSEMITEAEAKRMGIRQYIMKPLIIRELGNAIRWALDQN